MIFRVIRRARFYWRRIARFVHRISAQLQCKLGKGIFDLPFNVLFVVPVRVDGKGSVKVGSKTSFGCEVGPRDGNGGILLQARKPESCISIGSNCHLNNNVTIVACQEVVIGDNCLIGNRVTVFDSDFHDISPDSRYSSRGQSAAVSIGDDVWIGTGAMILKGVSIGAGSIVAAMAVVTKSVPGNCIVAGIPARVIKRL